MYLVFYIFSYLYVQKCFISMKTKWPRFTESGPHVEAVVSTAWRQDPEDRPDAELLLDLLGSCSSAEAPPVLPLPPGPTGRTEIEMDGSLGGRWVVEHEFLEYHPGLVEWWTFGLIVTTSLPRHSDDGWDCGHCPQITLFCVPESMY